MVKDHLMLLLKTLTKQERKTFITQNGKIGKSRTPYYLKLYKNCISLINKNLSEDEITEGMERFLARKPTIKRDIANIRNQLKEKVLLSLMDTQSFKDNKTQFYINSIKICLQRKLYNYTEIVIKQAKKWIKQNGSSKFLIEVTDYHLFLLGKQSGSKDLQTQQALIKELEEHYSHYGLELKLKNIFRQLTLIAQNDQQLIKEEKREAFNLAYKQFDFDNFPILKYESNKNTPIVNWFYRSKILYHRKAGSIEKASMWSKNLIQYFECNENFIKNFQSSYIKSICSYTRICNRLKNYDELEKNLGKVKSIYKNDNNYTALEATCDIGVLHYLHSYQYYKALDLANFINKEWQTISVKTEDGKLLWYCHSNLLLFWITDNYEKFEFWLNKGLDIPRSNKGKAYYFGIRLFELVNDFEQKNWHTFLHKIETLKRTLDNNESLDKFEETVVSYFRKLYNVYNSNKNINLNKNEAKNLEVEIFKKLKCELLNFNFKNLKINYEEILIWCESHLLNKTIKEVFETE